MEKMHVESWKFCFDVDFFRHISNPSVTAQVKETDAEERKAGHTFVPHYDICIKGKPSNLLSFVGPQTADTFKGAFQQLLE